jgi:hypothetical protein
MQKQQPIPQVNNVPLYAPQQVQQTKQVYAPMSTVGGQQYAATSGLPSQYQPQVQYAQQYAPQQQYKPKPTNHMSEIDRMLNG